MSVSQQKITRLPAQNGARIRSVAAAPSLANNALLASCLGLVCNMLPSVTAGLVKCVAAGDGGHDGCATWPPGVGVDNDVATLGERLQAGVEPQVMVQIARARLTAPFAGMVITGDLSRAMGAPVTRGEVLFEIAPLDDYRVELEVDERDVAEVSAGQHGALALTSWSAAPVPFIVDKVLGVAQTSDGRNVFNVDAILSGEARQLRPGMQGVARINTGERRLWWVWTHALLDRVRLRDTVQVARHRYRGRRWYRLRDAASGSWPRSNETAFAVVRLLNGEHNLATVHARLKSAGATLDEAELTAVINALHQAELLDWGGAQDAAELHQRARALSKRKRVASWLSPLWWPCRARRWQGWAGQIANTGLVRLRPRFITMARPPYPTTRAHTERRAARWPQAPMALIINTMMGHTSSSVPVRSCARWPVR